MKRNEQLRAGKLKDSQSRGQFLLVLMAFATGYMSSTIINMSQLEYWLNSQVKLWWQTPGENARPEPSKVLAKQERTPKLEFYTVLTQEDKPLLPETKVVEAKPSPKEEKKLELALEQAPKIEPKPLPIPEKLPVATSKGNYVVQLASFRYSSQAQSFRDKLVAKGFNVKISPVRQGPMQWYRVMLGPYSNLADAQKAKLIFQAKEHGSGMIRQMDA